MMMKMGMKKTTSIVAISTLLWLNSISIANTVSGDLMTWHRVSVTFDGPNTSELDTVNPFLNYRLQVQFTGPSGQIYNVPGFYAADGDAANTSVDSGNKWRVHFTPDQTGQWNYVASFRTGTNISISLDAAAGTSAGFFDGEIGSFVVLPTNKIGNDYRAKGMCRYVGKHHLQFAGNGEYYLKGGADSPENFLGYYEFDQTFDGGGTSTPGLIDGLHRYGPHAVHWQPGDPTWGDGKGKNIIGAVNYLGSKGMNNIYFLTYNVIDGDGRDTWPWTSTTERYRYDTSKLDQWEVVFSQMDAKGIQLHFVTTESENYSKFEGNTSSFSNIRKLYYRELVARFAHHHNVIWNIGEENGNSVQQVKDFADYLHAQDPYDHPVTVHTNYGQALSRYANFYGHPTMEATSIQGSGSSYNDWAIQIRQLSAAAGRKWAVYGDEQGPAVDDQMSNLDQLRKQTLWGNYMGGGAGVEWYFGYQNTFGDVQSEDWTVAEPLWNMTHYAMDFFQTYLPFAEMEPDNNLTSVSGDYCFYKAGQVYAVYLPSGGTTDISLPAGSYTVKWYNPRSGGALQDGSVTTLQGPGSFSIGQAPANTTLDWAVLITTNLVTRIPGDFNNDGCVNTTDLAALVADWLRCNDPADLTCDDVLAPAPQPLAEQAAAPEEPIVYAPAPVLSVSAGVNGTVPYTLQSITVGSYTITAVQLKTGTSSGVADQGGSMASIDDFDLNSIAARNAPSQIYFDTINFGGQNWQDTNGNNPDFFLFEAGGNDNNVGVQAIFPDNSLGQSLNLVLANWASTGLSKVGAPNAGQVIFGTSFAITDLKNASGIALTNSSIIKGLRFTSATLDPSGVFAAVESGPNSHWHLNEGVGTITVDSISNSYPGDGTLIGNIAWAVGPNPVSTPITTIDFGSALSFPAGSGYVDCGADVKLQQITNKMTLAAWVKTEVGNGGSVIAKGTQYGLSIDAGPGKVRMTAPCGNAAIIESISSVDDGNWHHIAAVFDGSTVKFYIDARLDNTVAVTGSYDSCANAADAVEMGSGFVGFLDDIRLLSLSMSQQDIIQLSGIINNPPQVNAGPDQTAFLRGPTAFQMSASAGDDGKPLPPTLTLTWTVQSKPAGSAVVFSPDALAEDPLVTIDTAGTYVLRLTANDSQLAAYDEMTIIAVEPNCQYVRDHNLVISKDIAGPQGISDCRVDLYDFAKLAESWLICSQ
jgi:hypothetical protein